MARPLILVVDDSELLLDISQTALEHAGYRTLGARTVAQLEQRLAGESVDLILLDVQMPELFGNDLVGVLRSRGVGAPIYLYSCLDDVELEALATAAGAAGYISKSDGLASLVQRVRAALM